MKSNSNSLVILISISISTFLLLSNAQSSTGQATGGSLQYLNFYNSTNCGFNPLISINASLYNITLEKAVSMKVNGMWEIGFCKLNTSSESCSKDASVYISSEGSCVPFDIKMNWTSITTQTVRYGDSYQSNGTISLFDSTEFSNPNGKSPVDTRGFNSTVAMTISSWFFTGNHEWALYEGANYTGKETCLKPSDDVVSNGYGFTYELVSNLTIRSVGYRCTGGTSGGASQFGSRISFYFMMLTFLTLFCVLR